MISVGKITNGTVAFVVDYIERHAHPLNAVCHVFGVPLAFFGLYKLFAGQPAMAATCLFLGYLLQYLGHRAHGNEVGEVTLIKNIWRKLAATRKDDAESKQASAEGTLAGDSSTPSQSSGTLVETRRDN